MKKTERKYRCNHTAGFCGTPEIPKLKMPQVFQLADFYCRCCGDRLQMVPCPTASQGGLRSHVLICPSCLPRPVKKIVQNQVAHA